MAQPLHVTRLAWDRLSGEVPSPLWARDTTHGESCDNNARQHLAHNQEWLRQPIDEFRGF
jgi:hypothetical protein